ncbi:cysteine--tRNA ligase [Oceanithermus desulfurans]|uniref:Cysteine--tRNA ligase n=2 Tax=Oceanithermus desulfurans TaxID=227924 RepID=A0A511RHZ2_9DEIN|nr:cysteine--tRNA ligase [Oceanithermus desulfurans]MBB6030439.1 cysteinyl-tRNA synthetase [Oceanithermus desulfurans]GEM89260.1 cysteine--tRNA ligase [Oceanithermus desulfurans NBRC 100063]
MPFYLYDTMQRKKVEFVPATPGHVGIYVCGPTVYSDAHLGHGRAAVVYDVLRRWLMHEGYRVRFVSNVTDVGHLTDDADEGEDKIAKRAKLERLEPMEVADKYFWRYFEDTDALNVAKPSITPRASGHIIEQIELTKELLDRGYAYEVNGSVYFRAAKWPDYGKLSGRRLEDQQAGARVEVRGEKEDPRDWALWKRAEPEHIMRWPSPWGEGYPGWHIECSAMSLKYLGEGFDIHAGGIDLQFPHHECEIAQAEAAGHAFARYWMHHNHVLLNGEKMAKSTGNFITLRELLERHEPMVVRLYLLQSHYRSVLDLTEAGLEAAARAYFRLLEAYRSLRSGLERAREGTLAALEEAIDRLEAAFAEAMNDDLGTPEALAALFSFLPELNKALAAAQGRASLERALETLERLGEGVLGLFPARVLEARLEGPLLEGLIELLLEQREAARSRRDFPAADAIRARLGELGVVVEDTPHGAKWRLAPR